MAQTLFTMKSKPKNLFPDNLQNFIASNFSPHTAQVVMLQMFQTATTKSQNSDAPSPETVLHLNELTRFNSYKLIKRRNEFLTGRYCAKEAIINYYLENREKITRFKMQEIEIHPDESGRPTARIRSDAGSIPLEISIAHSRDYGVAVAAESICGIDLQIATNTLLRVQCRFCTDSELVVMKNALPQETLLTRLTLLWAAKEAVKKALSLWWMPGFLDLQLTSAKQHSLDPLQLTLIIPAPATKNSQLPQEVTVSASTYLDYGLAVCFINKDRSNA